MSGSLCSPEASIVFMARQPILSRDGTVTAYELLFRDPTGRPVGPLSSQQEAAAIVQSVVDIGLDKMVGTCKAFVNVPATILQSPTLTLLPPDRVVLEILEDVDPSDELIECMKHLRELGYTIALDDFVFDGRLDRLLPHCHIVKVEYPAADKLALRRNVQRLKSMGITTLAEKVEEAKDHRLCMNSGFDLFQGYFFAKPELVPGSALKANLGLYGQLLQELQSPTASLARVEQLLSSDARLTHQLLRIASSAAYSNGGVTSLRVALISVGTAHLVALVALMMMADRAGSRSNVVTLGTVRAKLCEEIARKLEFSGLDRHFTAGLLSVLDAVMGLPMKDVVAQIPLAPELAQVLLDQSGPGDLCTVLRLALAIEAGNWSTTADLNLKPVEAGECYLNALRYEEDLRSDLAAAA